MRIKPEMTSPTRYFVCILFLASTALAQEDRLRGPIDNLHRTALHGNVNPHARHEFDAGAVDPSMKLSYMTLMLKPSGSQQADLEQLLTEQQDRKSPQYHKWLTPEQYADRFALSPADIGKIRAWLEGQGFTIDHVARSRNWLAFNGTAAQVSTAFRTEMHYYSVDAEKHFANATEPLIPAALESLVIGLLGLDDFHPKRPTRQLIERPDLTLPNGIHLLGPSDVATIYDIARLYANGIDGTGQSIVVAGQSNINPADIAGFRTLFNLPSNVPKVLLVPGSQDPGITHDQGEADLDIEWVGAVARKATIIYVYSTNALASAQYAIDQDLARIISYSFGGCEAAQAPALLSSGRSLAQQGNAQGITWLAASGDSGAAGCDKAFASPQAAHGFAVSFPASIPEVTAVAGTEFVDQGGNYWGTTNSPTGASALSYIPEAGWNESRPTNGIAASGGGLSGVYPNPSWQIGPGIQSVNARAVPDMAAAAASHDGYSVISGGQPFVDSGTSAATPVLAGIVALLNEQEGGHGLGNINPNLYRLAQTKLFHDITIGSNVVPCAVGTPQLHNRLLWVQCRTWI